MVYLESFTLPSVKDETEYKVKNQKFDMECYAHTSAYPFGIFPPKGLEKLTFDNVTILYGGNGSGKSTLLNVIAEKLGLDRTTSFNDSVCMNDYLRYCSYCFSHGIKKAPEGSAVVTSDGVFDFLLDIRSYNKGVDRKRENLFSEYEKVKDPNYHFTLNSLDDYEELKRKNEIKSGTKSAYTARRLGGYEKETRSNGESAFSYFTEKIKEDALYLLDEPENSLSAVLQKELLAFIEDSARFYNCQFIIATHSPFLLSMKGARIYDLDSTPVVTKKWSELENMRLYFELFSSRSRDFGG